MQRIVSFLLLFIFAAITGYAQVAGIKKQNSITVSTEYVNPKDSTSNSFRIWRAPKKSKLVILLPPYGGNHDYYNNSKLPQYLNKLGFDLSVLYTTSTGYQNIADILQLDTLIRFIINKYQYDKENVVLGGFSAGGYGIFKYALLKLAGENNLMISPKAIFSVDAPLDLERWYNGMAMFLERIKDEKNLFYGEFNYLTSMFREIFGGDPGQKPDVYRKNSIVSAALPSGGNAQFFKNIPIRLYTEPDMNFYNQFGLDYYSINAIDQVTFINILKISGNKNASLVLTSGKGYRADLNNMRMPHSWSIVNEKELADWIASSVK